MRFFHLLILSTIISCSAGKLATQKSEPEHTGVMKIIEGCPDSLIELAVNDTLQIKLKTTPGTGYQWVIDSTQSDLKTIEQLSWVYKDVYNDGRVGGPAILSITLKPITTGDCKIMLLHRRLFEPKSMYIDKCLVTIRIK